MINYDKNRKYINVFDCRNLLHVRIVTMEDRLRVHRR
jgi:hypothetical protein